MPSRTIANSASEMVPENRLRKSLTFMNEDTAIDIFLKQEEPNNNTISTTDHDLRLGPGDGSSLNSLLDGEKAVQGRWTIVAASGTPRISWFETEDVKR
jgi:hypothetical protein